MCAAFANRDVELIYFPGKGRGESIRMLLALGGVPFKDTRIPFEQWSELKPTTLYGSIPVLKVDGKMFGQTLAVARLVARETGMAGKDAYEAAEADAVVDTVVDAMLLINTAMEGTPDLAQRKVLLGKFRTEGGPAVMTTLEKFHATNGGSWMCGNNMTWADVFIFIICEFVDEHMPGVMQPFSQLNAIRQKVAQIPRIKAHIENRPTDHLLAIHHKHIQAGLNA